MAASPSSFLPSPLCRSPLFTPIPELDKEEEEEVEKSESEPEPEPDKEKNPTPLPQEKSPATKTNNRQLSVLCTNCRPSPHDKSTSVVPLDRNYETTPTNPKTILHSLIFTLTRTKSPRPAPAASSAATSAGPTKEEYRLAAEELAGKLARANRRRDEALLEASRLRRRVSDLERRLGSNVAPDDDDPFPAAVEDARAAVRELSRSILIHVRPNRIATTLRMPVHDTNALLIYVEALLNRVFYNEFEKVDAEEAKILNPAIRCQTNHANYEAVRQLTWEQVLHKGTKHYNQGFSKFCDEKMSEIVGMLGWARAWPESLLQSFFKAAKEVWIVHLLGRCIYPGVMVMRVDREIGFDGEYMEEVVVGTKRGAITPVSVRMVVALGFYLSKGGRCLVIKCMVVCGYGEVKKNSD